MGFRYYLPVKRALRDAAGLAAGDAVVVEQAVRMLHDGRRHP